MMLNLETPHQNSFEKHSVLIDPRSTIRLVSQNLNIQTLNWPLPSHYIEDLTDYRIEYLQNALDFIQWLNPDDLSYLNQWVRYIFWLGLKPDQLHNDQRITSASFPEWPGCVFISNKALFHIPPNTIFIEPSLVPLSENLIHEATHQEVNQSVLSQPILSADFDSKTAPKVFIDWRKDQISRNQFWELDRCYHACAVYSRLIRWRQNLIERADKQHLTEAEFNSVVNSQKDALMAFSFLSQTLDREEYQSYFGDQGRMQINKWCEQVQHV